MPENTVPTFGGSFYSRKRRLQNFLSLAVQWKKSLQNVPCPVQRTCRERAQNRYDQPLPNECPDR